MQTLAHEEQEGARHSCRLAKEIRLQHGAPVIAMQVIDQNDLPVDAYSPATSENDVSLNDITVIMPYICMHIQTHRVIIVSEEQLKCFHLPSLRPLPYKYKLTAHEGVRIRKVAFARLPSRKGVLPALSLHFNLQLCACRRRDGADVRARGDEQRRGARVRRAQRAPLPARARHAAAGHTRNTVHRAHAGLFIVQ